MSFYKLAATLALAAAAMASPASAQADPNHVYGPDPGWAKFRQVAEAGVIARLIDPESARISWLSGYSKNGFKPAFSRRIHGYVACGTVNARNRMGGYAGATTFIVVVDFDRTLFVNLDGRPGGMQSEMCEQQIVAGRLPPVPRDEPSSAASASMDGSNSSTAAASTMGITVRPMPEGAYVASVQPNSAASAAGLTAGMVISSINGLPLSGMGDAMAKVVAAAGAGATLTVIGGKTITLGATP